MQNYSIEILKSIPKKYRKTVAEYMIKEEKEKSVSKKHNYLIQSIALLFNLLLYTVYVIGEGDFASQNVLSLLLIVNIALIGKGVSEREKNIIV